LILGQKLTNQVSDLLNTIEHAHKAVANLHPRDRAPESPKFELADASRLAASRHAISVLPHQLIGSNQETIGDNADETSFLISNESKISHPLAGAQSHE